MIDEKTQLKIEAYLEGRMTNVQKKSFEATLKNNEELRNEVALFKSINSHLNENEWESINSVLKANEIEALNSYFKSSEATHLKATLTRVGKSYTSRKNTSYLKYLLPIAASFIIAILLFKYTVTKPSFDDLYVQYYSKDLPSLVSRGDSQNLLQQGIETFENNDYKKSVALFEDYKSSSNTVNPFVYSYLGIAQLELKNYTESLHHFNDLLDSESLDAPKALWYKSLIFLKTKDTLQLKKTLKLLLNDPSKYKNEEVREILDEIDY